MCINSPFSSPAFRVSQCLSSMSDASAPLGLRCGALVHRPPDCEDQRAQNLPPDLMGQVVPSGTAIERRIDGTWFQATVTDSYIEGGEILYNIQYADDGNREAEVSGSELRLFTGMPPHAQHLPSHGFRAHASADRLCTAERALDKCGTIARLHGNDDEQVTTTFVVNGASTKLGTGGGLHCVRFLRESVGMR